MGQPKLKTKTRECACPHPYPLCACFEGRHDLVRRSAWLSSLAGWPGRLDPGMVAEHEARVLAAGPLPEPDPGEVIPVPDELFLPPALPVPVDPGPIPPMIPPL